MAADGAFSDVVRFGVLERDANRCVGCQRTQPLTLQHRRARGMGGTSGTAAGRSASPANALVLCGSGTTGCHGWTEDHPEQAELLGWRIGAHDQREAWRVPVYGWWLGGPLWRLLLPSEACGWAWAHPEDYPDLLPDVQARALLPGARPRRPRTGLPGVGPAPTVGA